MFPHRNLDSVSIGVAEWSLGYYGIRAIHLAAQVGCNAIHLDANNLGDRKHQKELIQISQDTGVKITALVINSLCDFGMCNFHSSKTGRIVWNLIQKAIDHAYSMQIDLVVLPSFDNGEIKSQEDYENTIFFLKRACEFSSVAIATENSLGAEELSRLLNLVDHKNLKVLFDTYNPVVWGYYPSELLLKISPKLCDQIHAKDGKDGIMGNALLLEGDANFNQTAATLMSLSFNGDMILENEYYLMSDNILPLIERDIRTIENLFNSDPSFRFKKHFIK